MNIDGHFSFDHFLYSAMNASTLATSLIVAAPVALWLAGGLARRLFLVPTLTVMSDLPQLGKPRQGPKMKGEVVVCGGR